MSLKGESPECCKAPLTKNGTSPKAAKGQQVTEAVPKEPESLAADQLASAVAPFVLPEKSEPNQNGVTTIFAGQTTKEEEKEHYHFLNEMRVRLNVDEAKIIDLEARISCK